MKAFYTLKGVKVEVTPVDGESLPEPQPGISHGFQHYVDKNDKLMGFCGTAHWEENAKPVASSCQH